MTASCQILQNFIFGDTREDLSGGPDHQRIRTDAGHVIRVAELTIDCRTYRAASIVCRVRSEKRAGLDSEQYHLPYPRAVIELRGKNYLQLPKTILDPKSNMTGIYTLILDLLGKVYGSLEHLSLCFDYVDNNFMLGEYEEFASSADCCV